MPDTICLGTKAESLDRLRKRLTSAQILPQITTTVAEWQQSTEFVLSQLEGNNWEAVPLVVRSSALLEDHEDHSMAGKFDSVLNIVGREQLESAVAKVIESYEAVRNLQELGEFQLNQILIQPMLQDVALSGVAFTIEPSTGAPYYIINYDHVSGSTDTVTSGCTNELNTYVYYQKAAVAPDPQMAPVVSMLQELERLCGSSQLDVEFAVDSLGSIYLLQVRRLSCVSNSFDLDAIDTALSAIAKKFDVLNRPHPSLMGKRTVLAVMPDWNPAEIIGIRPNPLSLSLYKEVITDSIWAYQRNNYGYKNLRSHPLLVDMHGVPYVDVRVSFNSFLPNSVSTPLGEKLVNYYIKRLIEMPEKHDKVEFDIIFSCYSFDLSERIEALLEHGFTIDELAELKDSLRTLTHNIIHRDRGIWLTDVDKIRRLEVRRERVLNDLQDSVSLIYWLLEDCKRYGTLPFAGLARAGFIAVQLLRSLVVKEIISQSEYDLFLANLQTISTTMTTDLVRLSKEAFLKRYGHLRPGTYDILSPRYDEDPEGYFDWYAPYCSASESTKEEFSLTLNQLRKIEGLLRDEGLELQPLELFDFIKSAIEGREYAKFEFTKNLSLALSLFAELGAEYGFSRADCSFANIKTISTLYSSSADIGDALAHSIAVGRKQYEVTKGLTLPEIITERSQVFSFHRLQCQPNFITHEQARAAVASLESTSKELEGKIVCIPSADPGYDWIFSRRIAGLITAYGGTNSHMAIRAAELKIPAVIGAGETLYRKWSTAKMLELDCAKGLVRILS